MWSGYRMRFPPLLERSDVERRGPRGHIDGGVISFKGLFLAAAVAVLASSCASVDAGRGRTRGNMGLVPNRSGDISGGAELCECLIQGCAESDVLAEELFRDNNWRFAGYPYENHLDVYVLSSGERNAAAQLRSSYIIAADRGSKDPSAYALSGSIAVSLCSGFTLQGAYIFAEEDISSPGYLHQHFVRLGIGHLLSSDSNAWMSLGMNMVLFKMDEEFPDPDEEYFHGGIGVDFSSVFFVREPAGVRLSVTAAATTGGTVTDIELGFGFYNGPWELSAGFRSLDWDGGDIKGPFVSACLWF